MASQQPLIKPAQLDNLPFFTEEKKNYYKTGLSKLWNVYETNPQGSPQRNDAETKIRAASQKIMSELSQAKGGRPQSGGGPQQQRPPTAGSMSAGGQQNGAGAGAGTPQSQGSGTGLQVTPAIRATLSNVIVHVPNNLPQNQHPAYKHKWFQTAAGHLQQRDFWVAKGKEATQQMNHYQNNQQQVPPQVTEILNKAKRGVMEATTKWDQMQQKNENERQNNLQRSGQGQGGGQGGPGGQQQPPQMNGSHAPEMARSGSQGAGVKQEPRTSMSPQQHSAFPQQQQAVNTQNAPSQGTPQPQPPQPSQQQPQHTPQTASQPQPPQNFPQQHPQQQQQYQNQQQRPPMPQQMSQGQMPPQQHQQTPASAVPNQLQQPQRNSQALSQQAAMAQAAQSHNDQRQQMPAQPQSNQPQVPNGLPFNVPQSATQPTPTSAYPQGPPSLQATPGPTNKFPIPKQLHMDPRTQQPVPGPPSRPTYANTGMLGQPAVQRQPPFTLEGEGDRVLSKRKLDELVRQVTGADTAASALDPEVEESVMQVADDFVDDIIVSACKLAKLRPGAQLDLRDFQIILERNYGIRVPGFALDEVRAVRKFAPAPGWQSKMGAIQTAKTLGGVGKGDL